MSELRRAAPADIPAIVAIGEESLSSEKAARQIAHSEDEMAVYAAAFIRRVPEQCAFVLDDGGEVIGFIFVLVSKSPISREIVGKKMSWIVRPGREGEGLRLLRAAEAWAAAMGATRFLASLPSANPREVMMRLGYEPFETVYERRL
jgi:predicted N-acetyltransferase YhbS